MDNKEMSLTELDAEMAIALPERDVMWCFRISHSFNRNHILVLYNVGGTANAQTFARHSSAMADASVNIYYSN